MTTALAYIWLLPVAIGTLGAYYFAMQDLGPQPCKVPSKAKTEDE